MSKIGKQPLTIKDGVTLKIEKDSLIFHGSKGELSVPLLPNVSADVQDGILTFKINTDTKQAKSNWGTVRSLAENALMGVTDGFEKVLEIEGVGFRAVVEGKNLILNIGYSHPVKVDAPDGITISVEKNTIKIAGIDKYLVGQIAADIRALKKPEPYKGKGIRYKGEVIRRKSGKKVAGTTA